MPVEGINGILNVESAALHAPQVGVANTNPQHILSVGSNLYVSGDSSDVLTVDGNVVCEGVKVGLIEIIPSYDLEAVANVGNSTSNTIQFTNPDTGIVTTGNVSVGKDLNVTGNLNVLGTTTTIDTDNLRVQDPIIELGKDNAGTGDLGLIMTRPSGSSNVAVIFDEDTDTLELGYTNGGASDTTITMDLAPLSVNVNGNLSVTSNLEVGTANLFVDTVNSRVGVGTSIPTESLDVVGNMNLQQVSNTASIKLNSNVVTEFPRSKKFMKFPRLLLTYAAQSSQGGYENYVVNQSSVYSSESSHGAYLAFRGNQHWLSSSNSFDGGDDVFNGTNGPWISIQLPTKIKLEYLEFSASSGRLNQLITAGSVYASNDGSTWINIGSLDNLGTYTNVVPAHVDFTHTTLYDRYLLHITANQTNYVHMEKLSLFGVPEYDPEADGVDVVVKSVPNVPNTDWLEVYYDAKDLADGALSTTSGAITGLGGTTINGTAFGDPQVSNGAFVFDGSGDYISGTLPSSAIGEWVNSMSMWFKASNYANANIIFIGNENAINERISIAISSTGQLTIGISNSNVKYASAIPLDFGWHHLTYTYAGGVAGAGATGYKLYVDGVNITQTDGVGSGTLDLPTGPNFFLGSNLNGGTTFNGSIANFRLYSKALNADQVKELYDYQKDYFLGSKSQVTLYKGHLGVGVTEPSGQLELAGDERIQEYPPGPMGPSTSYETHIPGHGVFCWDTVNYYSGSPVENYNGSGMYAKDAHTTGWYGPYQNNNGYTGGNVYSGTDFAASTTSGLFFDDAYGTRYYGAWTTFKLPYKINLKKLHIDQWGTTDDINTRCAPEDGVILGSNDGTKWYHVHTFVGLQYGGTAGTSSYSVAGEDVTINCNTDYNQY